MSSSLPLTVPLIRLAEDDPARRSATTQEATIAEAKRPSRPNRQEFWSPAARPDFHRRERQL